MEPTHLPGPTGGVRTDLTEESKRVRLAALKVLEAVQSGTANAELAASLEKVTSALKTAVEIQRSGGELARLDEEVLRLRNENASAGKRAKSERLRDYVALLTPIITVATLAATLVTQTWQFTRAEEAKREESTEAQWQEAVKGLTASGALPPGVVALQPFLRSAKYGEQARDIAANLLATSSNQGFFDGLFGTALTPVTFENLPRLIRLDRALRARSDPLASKSWDSKMNNNDFKRLSSAEIAEYDYSMHAAISLGAELGNFLRTARPSGTAIDLSGSYFFECQWEGIDFTNVNLSNAVVSGCNIQGAKLKEVTQFGGVYLYRTAWWEANSINAALLEYLTVAHPLQNVTYGPFHRTYTEQQYKSAVTRLRATL